MKPLRGLILIWVFTGLACSYEVEIIHELRALRNDLVETKAELKGIKTELDETKIELQDTKRRLKAAELKLEKKLGKVPDDLEGRVGHLEEVTKANVPRTCDDLFYYGVQKSGFYRIDPGTHF